MSVKYSQYAPEFEISINGKIDSTLRQNIVSIYVDETIGGAANFGFTINDKFDVDKQQFVWFDNKSLQPGTKISIKIGYAERAVEILPQGVIEDIATTGFTEGSPTMTVRGYDASKNWLNQQPNLDDSTTDQPVTGSMLLGIMASDFGLKSVIDKTTEIPTRITHNPTQTYGNILADQAQSVGWEFFISRGIAYYINPRSNKKASHTFEWGRNLISFQPRINATQATPGVRVSSPSPTSSESITAEATSGSEERMDSGSSASDIASINNQEPREEIILCNTPEEAEIRARASLNRQSDNLLTCEGKIIGSPDLEIGQLIQINGLGNRFSGKYFVTRVRNTIQNGYLTSFTVRKNTIKEPNN